MTGTSSALETVTITVNGANDAPVLSGLKAAVTFNENTVNAGAQVIDSDVAFRDIDGNLNGGRMVVSGVLAEDTVSIANQGTGSGQIGFSGGTVTYGGVTIGTATGGHGSAFTVVFNANATSAAVDALIQNLTYADSSDTPTASRTLNIRIADGAGTNAVHGDYVAQTGSSNPFNGIDVGTYSSPTFGDLDGDGDLDMLVGERFGSIRMFENTGTASAPVFVEHTGAANPLNGVNVGTLSRPALVDLDGDGDLDVAVGQSDGTLKYFLNTGSSASPTFIAQTGVANPFNGIDVVSSSDATFIDLDHDGDRDLAVGGQDGTVRYFENIGSAATPIFVERTGGANPFDGIDVGSVSSPHLGDVDGDGDFDLTVGNLGGIVRYYENTGSAGAAVFTQRTGAENPFASVAVQHDAIPVLVDLNTDGRTDLAVGGEDGKVVFLTDPAAADPFTGIDVNAESAPALADVDGDGDDDLLVGDVSGDIHYFKNTGTATDPHFVEQTGASSPFNGISVGGVAAPEFVDLDNDGDLDLVIGQKGGIIRYFKNTGTTTDPHFVQQTGGANPFNGLNLGNYSRPAFADLDGDGDLDLFSGSQGGTIRYFINTGSASSPAFLDSGTIAGDIGDHAAPTFGDVDGDGDLDLVIGEAAAGNINYFENTGTTNAPAFVQRTGTANPYNAVNTNGFSTPKLIDLDHDGDLDLVVGHGSGRLTYVWNDSHHVTINVTAQNDVPVAFDDSQTVGEDIDLAASVPNANDPDGTIIDYVLDGGPAKGTVSFEDDDNGHHSNGYTFVQNGEFDHLAPGETEEVSFTYHAVSADAGVSAVHTVTITVEGANDRPVLNGLDASATFGENTVNAAPQIIDSDVTLTDAEGDFTGGALTVSGLLAEDVVSINNQGTGGGQIGFSGGSVTYGGVLIGAAAGGHGANLVVTFNGSATTAAVDALIQNLTYANTSDTPTASRDLKISIGDADSVPLPILVNQSGGADPFAGIDNGSWNAPAFGDFDHDGDLDFIAGDSGGTFHFYLNTGSADAPAFSELTGSANPLNGLATSGYSAPVVVDLDGDGDLDMVAGSNSGIVYLKNTGTTSIPHFVQQTGAANPFNGITDARTPTLADIDHDGDLDLLVSATDNSLHYFENTGSATAAAYVERTGDDDPFAGISAPGSFLTAALGDLDGDGDVDLALGTDFNGVAYFENQGTATDPYFVASTTTSNPFFDVVHGAEGPSPNGIATPRAVPTFVDLDHDGRVDAVVGATDGFHFLENTGDTGTVITVNVTAENDAPVASNDARATDADTPLVTAVPAATDADGTIDHYVLDSTVGEGRLSFNSDGSYTFNPDGAFNGLLPEESSQVSFTYHAVDDLSASSGVQTVTITVNGADEAAHLDAVSASVTFAESTVNAGPQVIDPDVVLFDREGDYSGGALTVSGLLAEDTVAINDQGTGSGEIGVSGGTVTYGGVAIGTVSGGHGGSLVVTFNGSATTAAIDALVQNVTFADASDAPTAARTLTFTLTDHGGHSAVQDVFSELTGAANPLNVIVGQFAAPAFADLDHDGDLDMVLGENGGTLSYYQNTGSGTDPVFVKQTGSANPLNGVDLGDQSTPAFGDLDGDGDVDLVVGDLTGTIAYFKNTGTASSPIFTQQSGGANPFNAIDLPNSSEPALADLDHDGDLDLIVGTGSGQIQYFLNTGTSTSPVFAQQTGGANPFNGIDVGDDARPTLIDFDRDGDLDLVVGEHDGVFNYFENTGTASAPVFVQRVGADNPFDGVDVGQESAPAVVDLDGDRDFDLVTGENNIATLHTYENLGSPVTVTVNVTAENDAPVALDAAATTRKDAVLSAAVHASDADGSVDHYVLDTDVGRGVLTFDTSDGTYSYDPNGAFANLGPNHSVDVTFTYHAVDNDDAASGVQTVTITVSGLSHPSLDGVTSPATFAENTVNATPQVLDSDVSFNDQQDLFNGGALTVAGLLAEDVVSIQTQGMASGEIGFASGDVYYGGTLIGTATGGAGATFTVSFNNAATADAIDALIQHLTYANTSDTPTASRVLSLSVTDANGAEAARPLFVQETGGDNPFAGVDVDYNSAPAFADIDGDGDLDLVVGRDQTSHLYYFENTGSGGSPNFVLQTGGSDPFNDLDTGRYSAPSFGDLDGDGDIDLVVGTGGLSGGVIKVFENTGTTTSPAFVELTGGSNPFDGVSLGGNTTPTLGDVDGDGDLDAVFGTFDGTIHYFENTGTAFAPAFIERTGIDNPFPTIDFGQQSTPSLGDIDGDGDLDLVVGDLDGDFRLFENTGSATAPAFIERTGSANPFATTTSELYATPALADVDGDGDIDLAAGQFQGGMIYVENVGSTDFEIEVDVTAENDAPTLTGLAASVTFAENTVNAAPQLIDTSVTVSDPEGNLDGGSLVVSGVLAEDTISIRDQGTGAGEIGFSGSNLTYEGVLIGTATGGAGASLAVTFNVNATPAAVEALAENLTYANSSDTPTASRELSISVADSADSTTSHITINVTAENDAPVATGDAQTTNEDNPLSASVPAASDVDGTVDHYVLDGDVAKGELTLNPDGTYTFDPNGDFEALGDGDSEEVSFTYHAVDDGSASSATQTVTITVTGVNDPASIGDLATSVTFGENAANGAPQTIDNDVSVADPEGNFDGGGLTVSGLLAEDSVSIHNQGSGAGQIGFSGGILSYEGTAIGTATGGSAGTDLVVTFNDSASTAAVDALVQDLTYANSSDTPTASRTLSITLHDGNLFQEHSGSSNPLAGIDIGNYSAPAFVDIDGDGDLDLVLGNNTYDPVTELVFYRNTGSATSPAFTLETGSNSPVHGLVGDYPSHPAFADIDGDGDADLAVGFPFTSIDHLLGYFRNDGTTSAPSFAEQTGADNPFDAASIRDAAPAFGDLDGDGDLDLIVGEKYGTLHTFENTGSAANPVYVEQTGSANPFNGLDVGNMATPALGDVDGDGDLDLVVGEHDGSLHYFENTGSTLLPAFAERTGSANPFDGFDAGATFPSPVSPTSTATATSTSSSAISTARSTTSRMPRRPTRSPSTSPPGTTSVALDEDTQTTGEDTPLDAAFRRRATSTER